MKSLKEKRLVKYIVIGITAFFIDYLLFNVLNETTTLSIYYSNTIAIVIGFLISFFGNRVIVFANDSLQNMHYVLWRQLLLYIGLLSINTVLSYLIILGLEAVGVKAVFGKVVSMIFIAGWNYVLYKKVIFKQKKFN